ncbi:hypothetical protein C5167_008035 [Papaver somniferum]|uniref:Glycosyltransferase 61 catalytic domain-containing protein n=2 Tax=Papaver somniferum TaxID=3469 RepID=A0A4Y7JXA5_PAPSO|nr:hypothetical protein C5167_008035 [Papaver somniferum]
MSNLVVKAEKHPHKNISITPSEAKLVIYFLCIFVVILIIFQIQLLVTPSSFTSSFSLSHKWGKLVNSDLYLNCSLELKSMASRLRQSVAFLPLKDLRYAQTAHQGHTWFMSSMYDTHEEGEVQYQKFPSNASKGRLLCIMGRDGHDGSWNSYALAFPDALPENATLFRGLTFVSYNHYNYGNIWHGLSALFPFVAWHRRVGECSLPARWILYHWGELRRDMSVWLKTLLKASFNGQVHIETFDGLKNDQPACFEEAVVMRHNEGGLSRERRIEVYDLLRCKARAHCNVSLERTDSQIGLTMFMRTGARSFKNQSMVIEIFGRECAKVEGCRIKVAYSNNLTFCEQVSLMSSTDILVSPHGAQLTNMFFMDKNSSVMEFFPKGWLKLAGVGQYVYHWIASWSGMKHQGAWRDPYPDPDQPQCEFQEDDPRCMKIYKGAKIGYNETFFAEWATNVLSEVKKSKQDRSSKKDNPKMAQTHNLLPKPSKRSATPTRYMFRERLLFFLLGIAIAVVIFVAIASSSLSSRFTQSYVLILKQSNSSELISSMTTKLRQSVTFLPLKDLRYSQTNQDGHTWFMSSMYDTHEEGEVQYQQFPSNASKGRLLCIMGRDGHDGSWNSYALAFPDALPENATFYPGLTFISNNHYNYGNIWHGLSALFPFVAWHRRVGKCSLPARWILFHWGELRREMSVWLETLLKASFNGNVHIETFDGLRNDEPACFEEAVVMRHNEGGMSRERRIEAYDLLRCKARVYCKVPLERNGTQIGLTMFMRTGTRSFKNQSAVTRIFQRECVKAGGCKLQVADSGNLTFCEQVSLMSSTDILVSPHGAQLTNMFFMDKNSSIMEFYPKGWLKLAGIGQYVYKWIASWSGMKHQGAWRDPNPDPDLRKCEFPEDDRRCMTIYKDGMIGHNETYFTEWARNVLAEVKINKQDQSRNRILTGNKNKLQQLQASGCACG